MSHESLQPSSADVGLQLLILCFAPFSPWQYVVFFRATDSKLQLPNHLWFLNLTTAAIICHCLDPHIEKRKEEGENRKKRCIPADQPRTSHISSSRTLSLSLSLSLLHTHHSIMFVFLCTFLTMYFSRVACGNRLLSVLALLVSLLRGYACFIFRWKCCRIVHLPVTTTFSHVLTCCF